MTRPRVRELGLCDGTFLAGAYNAITDVPGVQVGHVTIHRDGPRVDGRVSRARTGVTAILPRRGNVFEERVVASGFVLNGAGEVAGLTQVMEWGLIETPILLTSTMAVGRVADATVGFMLERFPGIGRTHDVILPVVGECDDSWLNDVSFGIPELSDVRDALEAAADGPVAEGSVGAGTGMMTCDFAGGIGTSSRLVTLGPLATVVGVLVLSNFGKLADLRMDGIPVGRLLEPRFIAAEKRRRSYGSIIVVVATDAPVLAPQLARVAKRAALGIGRVGSYAAHGSGEIVVAFSTANVIPRSATSMTTDVRVLLDSALDPLYHATVEATEEAILNALCASDGQEGRDGHVAPGLPLDAVQRIVREYQDVAARLRAEEARASTTSS